MRKSLFLLFAILFITGCSKDNDDNQKELQFIQVQISTENGTLPEGIVSVFYLNGYTINECPYKNPVTEAAIAYDEKGKMVFPVSKLEGDKMHKSESNGYSVATFYWDKLSSAIYGTPLANREYVVFIQLTNNDQQRAFKKITIDKNKRIKVKLPSSTEKKKEVNAQWTIEDY